jgi:hypothetical protein
MHISHSDERARLEKIQSLSTRINARLPKGPSRRQRDALTRQAQDIISLWEEGSKSGKPQVSWLIITLASGSTIVTYMGHMCSALCSYRINTKAGVMKKCSLYQVETGTGSSFVSTERCPSCKEATGRVELL